MTCTASKCNGKAMLRAVEVASLNGHPLIGMGLLQGSELRMMVEDAGVIEITPFDQL